MKPKVILHNSTSLDGRISGFIPDVGLYYELAAHWQEDATLTGCDTLLAAVEEAPGEEATDDGDGFPESELPLLVVTDSRGRIDDWEYWRRQPYWRDVVVFCTDSSPADYLSRLATEGIEHIVTGGDRVDLSAALEELNLRWSVATVRVDSGGTLNGALLRQGLVDEVSVLIEPVLVGGETPASIFRAPETESEGAVIPLQLDRVEQLRGDIVRVVYHVLGDGVESGMDL